MTQRGTRNLALTAAIALLYGCSGGGASNPTLPQITTQALEPSLAPAAKSVAAQVASAAYPGQVTLAQPVATANATTGTASDQLSGAPAKGDYVVVTVGYSVWAGGSITSMLPGGANLTKIGQYNDATKPDQSVAAWYAVADGTSTYQRASITPVANKNGATGAVSIAMFDLAGAAAPITWAGATGYNIAPFTPTVAGMALAMWAGNTPSADNVNAGWTNVPVRMNPTLSHDLDVQYEFVTGGTSLSPIQTGSWVDAINARFFVPAASAAPQPSASPTSTPAPIATPTPTAVAGSQVYHGCQVFPKTDWWYHDITNAPLYPNSASLVSTTASYSPGKYVFAVANEKVNLATNSTATYPVRFGGSHQSAYPSRMPWGSNFYVEGSGDSHSFVLNTDTCTDYESYGTSFNGSGVNVSTGGAYNLNQTFAQNLANTPQLVNYPAWGMTGIPMFPMILKWDDDLATGVVNHALAVNISDRTLGNKTFVAPAQSGVLPPGIPSGAHLRLHASWTQSGLNSQQQAVVTALKKYGAFVMDNGIPISIYAMLPADGNASHFNLPSMNFTLVDFDMVYPTICGNPSC